MTERDLFSERPAVTESTAITRVEQPEQKPPTTALIDLRANAMAVPVEVMRGALAEYQERRQTLREWLRSQLIEGVHFGYPPGLAPRFNKDGDMIVSVWKKGRNGEKGHYEQQIVSAKSWTAKPSFYKAGADFVCDLMGLVDVYDADMSAWQQLGSPQGTFVFRCRLFPKGAPQSAETLVGEGRGVRSVGQKGGDENNAIKMAKKSAKVDAVLNAYGLADLFTQDLEDSPPPGPEKYDNPPHSEGAPKAQPRGARVDVRDCQALFNDWKEFRRSLQLDESKESFAEWAEAVTGLRQSEAFLASAWKWADIDKCRATMKQERGDVDG